MCLPPLPPAVSSPFRLGGYFRGRLEISPVTRAAADSAVAPAQPVQAVALEISVFSGHTPVGCHVSGRGGVKCTYCKSQTEMSSI